MFKQIYLKSLLIISFDIEQTLRAKREQNQEVVVDILLTVTITSNAKELATINITFNGTGQYMYVQL